MTDYVLVGGGALAREILDWFAPGLEGSGSGFTGYLDDGDDPMAAYGPRLRQLGPIQGHTPRSGQELVLAVGSTAGKVAVAAQLKAAGCVFATLIHPTAWVSASARIGAGTVMGLHAHASADARVGEFVHVGAFSSVGHDASVGACCTLSSYVDLTGWVKAGGACLFGSGARVLPKVTIGDGCTIGAGAVVLRNVKSGVTVYAPPARSL